MLNAICACVLNLANDYTYIIDHNLNYVEINEEL